ncbi:hypothetical protein [Novosphingobium sp. KN65.2]|uniref:hypothetical protein n=1 Tax=Novosphingobium sp. KN65.2 TaxID=1478134 RepID=UPI0005E2ABEE|nr:hypothetical protein [Novosphingobium sp. KN65.2]CDO34032.1 hypothetical protein SPHV1_100066 [Novosphingobium sp. KN65.2]
MSTDETPAAHDKKRSAIRTWALIAVVVSSVFLMVFAWRLVDRLASPDWCNQALGATKYVNGRPDYAVKACVELMLVQLKGLSTPLLVTIGTFAVCLFVLVVIVLAGGRVQFSANRDGASTTIGRDGGD